MYSNVMEENGFRDKDVIGFYVHENAKGKPAVDQFFPIWKLL